MDEISSALKVANTAIKTVKVIDIVKKTVIAAAVLSCGVFAIRLLKK